MAVLGRVITEWLAERTIHAFYGLGPTLHVSDLLQTFVETLDQSQPGSGLLGEVTCVQVQLFGLRVQSFLVEIGLKCV